MLIPGMALTCGAFLLVLYSTFLTRSGILGETSVHSFTDLGLSGQLLLLLLFYTGAFVLLLLYRSAHIPKGHKEMALKSAEFFLFLGVLTLVFSALGITIATSIPVINAIFGTDWSAPASAPYFFYKWNVWFAIALCAFSGVAQFYFWNRTGKAGIGASLLRPFVIAVVAAAACIVYFAYTGPDFVYDAKYREWLDFASVSDSFGSKLSYGLSWFFMNFADEIYLVAAIFFLSSSMDIFIYLFRKNQKTRRVTGGSLAHTGFALMLGGILFSSGFQKVISINSHPEELGGFPSEEQKDNIVLPKGIPRYDVPGYEVTYLGKIRPHPPVRNISVIDDFGNGFLVRFTDSGNEDWSIDLPKDVFLDASGKNIDMEEVKFFLEDRMDGIPGIKRLNKRDRYKIRFAPVKVIAGAPRVIQSDSFIVVPETEMNPDSKESVSHPARKIFPGRDIYLFVSSKPGEDEENRQPKFRDHMWEMKRGDTVRLGYGIIRYKDLVSVDTVHTRFSLIASADLEVLDNTGQIYHAGPLYRVDKKGRVSFKEHYLEFHNTYFLFTGIDPETGKISIVAREELDAPEDYIVIKAIEKPWINILWLGTFVMLSGFFISWMRRRNENRFQETGG
jgi:cytochrome c-type biogenesis protein CcmF